MLGNPYSVLHIYHGRHKGILGDILPTVALAGHIAPMDLLPHPLSDLLCFFIQNAAAEC